MFFSFSGSQKDLVVAIRSVLLLLWMLWTASLSVQPRSIACVKYVRRQVCRLRRPLLLCFASCCLLRLS